jgi:hypothetical protein
MDSAWVAGSGAAVKKGGSVSIEQRTLRQTDYHITGAIEFHFLALRSRKLE